MYDRGEYIHLNQDVLKTSWRRLLKTKAKDIFKAPLAGRMFVGGGMCTLLWRVCQGIIVLGVSLGAAADGVVRNASGGSVCVCVCVCVGGGGGGGGRGLFFNGVAGLWFCGTVQ